MDYARVDDAYAAGIDAGRNWATTLAADRGVEPVK
jgi:hypothetical protein